ncbi:MAG: hypothetical protein ACTSU5_01690 [Promethearchaeota archaeon]
MTRVLLDTSYLMPLVGIQVESWTSEKLLKFLQSQHSGDRVYYASFSLFEVIAKGCKLILQYKHLKLKDVEVGVDAIVHSTALQRMDKFYIPRVMDLAFTFRRVHSDTIDCFILATAVQFVDLFCTFDHVLLENVAKDAASRKKILRVNAGFRVQFDDLRAPPVPFKTLV